MRNERLLVIAGIMILFFSSCSNDLESSMQLPPKAAIPKGMGRISINLAEPESRTILPQAPEFSRYAIKFQYQGTGVSEINETVDVLPYSKELLPGYWKVTVNAYVYFNNIDGLLDGEYSVASGEISVSVEAGISIPVSVDLYRVNTGSKGVFQYEIGLPLDDGIGSATLRILRTNKSVVETKDLLESPSGSFTLDEEYYFVQVSIFTGYLRSKTELIHIYEGHVTVAAGSAWNFNSMEGVYLNLSELSGYLSSAPANTANNPYSVKLIMDWASLSRPDEFLGQLYSVLNNRYVGIDLSESINIDEIGGTSAYSVNRSRLVSVVLPDGLTQISTNAFRNCTFLKTVIIPETVQSIGNNAFDGSVVFEQINFPASLSAIGASAFSNTAIQTVDLSNNTELTILANNAFTNCAALKTVMLPESLTVISNNVFQNCTALKTIILPEILVTIGACAFEGCTDIAVMDLSSLVSLTSIGDSAFLNCTSLKTVIFPNSLKLINANAFDGCIALLTVDFSECTLLASIGNNAFANCSSLSIVDLSGLIELINIGNNVFQNCSFLTVINLSSLTSLTSIGSNAFQNCNALTMMDLSGNISLTNINNIFRNWPTLVSVDLTGCKSLTNIDNSVFQNTPVLKTVNFSDCTSLASVRIYDHTTIENISLSGCISLNSVNFSGNTSLLSLVLPASLPAIDANAIAGCINASFSITATGNLSVDETGKILKLGSALAAWPSASSNIVIPEGITIINKNALLNNIVEIIFPSTMSNVSNIVAAIKELTSLQMADLSACTLITEITDSLFSNINVNASIIFPSSLEIAGNLIGNKFNSLDFSACTKMQDLYLENMSNLVVLKLPENLSAIKIRNCPSLNKFILRGTGNYYVLENGAILTSNNGTLVSWPSASNAITIPCEITAIGEESFFGNTSVTQVYCPESSLLAMIDEKAFMGCSSLTKVDLSNCANISVIGQSAFKGSGNLRIMDLSGYYSPPILLSSGNLIDHFDTTHSNLEIFVPGEFVQNYKTEWIKYAANIIGKTDASVIIVANKMELISAFSIIHNSTRSNFSIMTVETFPADPINVQDIDFMNKTIKLHSANTNEIVLSSNGSLFTIGTGVTFVMENIKLLGKNNNNAPLVNVNGKLVVKSGGVIAGNTYITSANQVGGGGVFIDGGILEIDGGEISNNTVNGSGNIYGGGVYATNGSYILLSQGVIRGNGVAVLSGNGGSVGGGISVFNNSQFIMTDGFIENNSVNGLSSYTFFNTGGGGVHVQNNNSVFYFKGGKIRGNTTYHKHSGTYYAGAYGGGVFVGSGGSLIMEGGIINGNSSTHSISPNTYSNNSINANGAYGGGIGSLSGNIIKTGGIVYGNEANGTDIDAILLRNTAQNDSFGGCGHSIFHDNALYVAEKLRRNETTYELQNIDSSIIGSNGGWIPRTETGLTIHTGSTSSGSWPWGYGQYGVRININGTDLPSIIGPAEYNDSYFNFSVYSGDEINVYWWSNTTVISSNQRYWYVTGYYSDDPDGMKKGLFVHKGPHPLLLISMENIASGTLLGSIKIPWF